MDSEYSHLPREIIEEILPRLPVKSLLKFRSVSKSWRSLIDSKRFMKTHLQNSIKNPSFPHHRVIFFDYYGAKVKQCSMHSLCNHDEFMSSSSSIYEYAYDPIPMDIMRWCPFDIMGGCCNGLVCILKQNCIFLCNPSTRIVKKLPEIDLGIDDELMVIGFGWVESSDDYKVFAVVSCYPLEDTATIYSSKTNSWKMLSYGHYGGCREGARFVSGKLHWPNWVGKSIVSLDLKTEMFGMIELPSNLQYYCHSTELRVIGGCLCVVYDKHSKREGIDVWVMKEYGVKESWQKLVTLSNVEELLRPPFSATFVVAPNGEILLFSGSSTLLVYYPQENVFRKRYNDEMHLYIESLVSPENV